MSQESARDGLLRTLDRIRVTANKLENGLTELHHIVRFDHRSAGARDRAQTLETELTQMAKALHELREHIEEESPRGSSP